MMFVRRDRIGYASNFCRLSFVDEGKPRQDAIARGDRGAAGRGAIAGAPDHSLALQGYAFDPLRVRRASPAHHHDGGHALDLLGAGARIPAEADRRGRRSVVSCWAGSMSVYGEFPDLWLLCYPEDEEIKQLVEQEIDRMIAPRCAHSSRRRRRAPTPTRLRLRPTRCIACAERRSVDNESGSGRQWRTASSSRHCGRPSGS